MGGQDCGLRLFDRPINAGDCVEGQRSTVLRVSADPAIGPAEGCLNPIRFPANPAVSIKQRHGACGDDDDMRHD